MSEILSLTSISSFRCERSRTLGAGTNKTTDRSASRISELPETGNNSKFSYFVCNNRRLFTITLPKMRWQGYTRPSHSVRHFTVFSPQALTNLTSSFKLNYLEGLFLSDPIASTVTFSVDLMFWRDSGEDKPANFPFCSSDCKSITNPKWL
jgi:hypothetical protein